MERWHVIEPDPSKSNHYYDDSLGDPYTCTDRGHNHPPRRRQNTDWLAFAVGGGVALLFILGVVTLVQALFG